MAGAFTHFLVGDYAKADKTILIRDILRLANKYRSFLILGSVSPDLPYLSFKIGNVNWADVMHKDKTNSIAVSGQDLLKRSWASKTPADEAKLVWLLGYISHLVTDATIHPIVQAIVGPYESNKEEHRLCEMTQDSLLYNLKNRNDIKYANFSEIIKFCKQSGFFGSVLDFWKGLLLTNYSDKNEEPHPEIWFTTYSDAIDAAEGDWGVLALFRHIGPTLGGYVYRTKADIENNFKAEKAKYFDAAKLPGGGTGFFPEVGFNKAITNVIKAWNGFYNGLSAPGSIDLIVKNWDLDTGIDKNSPDHTVTYWS